MNNITAIVDYGAGNTCSVINSLVRIGAEYQLTSDAQTIKNAARVILPGVGHAGAAMEQLNKKNLITLLKSIQQPLLGICLGMQLMFEHSEEGDTQCLGIISECIRRFESGKSFKVPHIGWNDCFPNMDNELFSGLKPSESMYFVHCYYAEKGEFTTGICDYTKPFSAAVQYKNFFGVQFHPEKSGAIGQKILENFISL